MKLHPTHFTQVHVLRGFKGSQYHRARSLQYVIFYNRQSPHCKRTSSKADPYAERKSIFFLMLHAPQSKSKSLQSWGIASLSCPQNKFTIGRFSLTFFLNGNSKFLDFPSGVPSTSGTRGWLFFCTAIKLWVWSTCVSGKVLKGLCFNDCATGKCVADTYKPHTLILIKF